MTNRTELAALLVASNEAYAKMKRNSAKQAWMDATRRMGAEVVAFGAQLEAYEAAWKEASAKFRAALREQNWSTEQVVEFMDEVGA